MFTPQALTVLKKRYLLRDENNQPCEQPDEMLWRVARAVAKDQESANIYHTMMESGAFLPNSPTLMNAGTGAGSLSACFVLPIPDTMPGIMKAASDIAMVQKFGGGTGMSLSRLRPKGSLIKSTHGAAMGPVQVLRHMSSASTMVTQGGKRDGANMAILRIDHPDVREFIHCKDDGSGIHNFNISLGLTDEFMNALKGNRQYVLVNPHTEKPDGSLDANEILDEIASSAWKTGDPGLWFIDRINDGKGNPVPRLGPIESCNPCGEQELYPFDACCLGSINLSYFADDAGTFNFKLFGDATHYAVRFLDDVLDVNVYAIPEIRELVDSIRRIGLGVMGWADLLIDMKIAYDSQEALLIAGAIGSVWAERSYESSLQLGRERGAFPLQPESIYSELIRNCTRTTIAPTGTISILADCSSGIEPLFALAFDHHGLEGSIKETFVNSRFEKAIKEANLPDSWDTIIRQVVDNHGSCQGLASVPDEIQRVFKTAHDISPEWHIKMQAVWQRYTDNAVSKTINMPSSATVEDVRSAYLMAYEEGCKGITIYRDGSKSGQVLTTGPKTAAEVTDVQPEGQYDILPAQRLRQPSAHGNIYITISAVNDSPWEMFATVGKSGSEVQALVEALGRVTSYTLRTSQPKNRTAVLRALAKQLQGIGGVAYGFGPHKVLSIPDGIGKAILRYLGESAEGVSANVLPQYMACPDCGGPVAFIEGCHKCMSPDCGWSACD